LHFSAVCDKDYGGNAWSSSNVPPYYSSESALPSAAYCTSCVLPDSNGDTSTTYWYFHTSTSYGSGNANGDFLFYFRMSPNWREPSPSPTLQPSLAPTEEPTLAPTLQPTLLPTFPHGPPRPGPRVRLSGVHNVGDQRRHSNDESGVRLDWRDWVLLR
jgi:hypothetical protein